MNTDEQAIRDLVSKWNTAATNSDLPAMLSLMADDVVFLVAGRPPMRGKDAFAAAFESLTGKSHITISSNIQEIQINSDWAYCWNQISVTTRMEDGFGKRRSGDALSILRKNASGAWLVVRDANMLSLEATPV